jgi:hypothetical protein
MVNLQPIIQDFFNKLCCPIITTCYSVTKIITSPSVGTFLLPAYTGFACTTDRYGSASGSGGFTSLWSAYNNTTPMAINDDNGVVCASNVRFDQNDGLAATFTAVNGVVYSAGFGLRKISADGLGAASVRVDIIRPDGTTISNIASGSSTRQGGGSGWDNRGHYENSNAGKFTANQTGTYTVVMYGTSVAPARVNYFDLQVRDTSGAVNTPVTLNYKKVVDGNVTTYYKEDGTVLTGTDLSTLQTEISNGTATEITCTF